MGNMVMVCVHLQKRLWLLSGLVLFQDICFLGA